MAAQEDSKGAQVYISDNNSSEVKIDGSLEFVHEYGGNNSKPSYQEASGAPVENVSPLGLEVGWFTTIFLNIGQMIGTGVFSTPASILKGVGSVGLSLIFWVLGFLIAASQLSVFVELATFFPNRSGAEVVYLEQAYPRPKYLMPTAFAVQSVLLSFSSSNCIVMAQYLYATGGHTPSDWELKGLATACFTFIVLAVLFSTKWSLRISNAVGVIKLITLIFISITGFVVLGGNTGVKDPHSSFKDSFSGTTGNGYGLSNALVKVNFAYYGYTNAFNVVNEVKNPIKILKRTGPASLLIVAILYLLCNIAYFAAIPKAELITAKELAASLFFKAVFGSQNSTKALNFLIALSAYGNLTSSIIGSSRIIRECGRQGVLPYPRVWASTKPFGTPIAPYILKWSLTVLMILAPPAGDAFNFIVDLQSYPANVFFFATTFGLLLIRRRRNRLGVAASEFRTWDIAIYFSLAVNVFILAMPWYPPPGGRYGGDVSFWYGTYCVVGLAILAVCGLYYVIWIYVIPHYRKYRIRQELIVLDDENAKVHRLIKVPLSELETWDSEHDVLGNIIQRAPASDSQSNDEEPVGNVAEKREV